MKTAKSNNLRHYDIIFLHGGFIPWNSKRKGRCSSQIGFIGPLNIVKVGEAAWVFNNLLVKVNSWIYQHQTDHGTLNKCFAGRDFSFIVFLHNHL